MYITVTIKTTYLFTLHSLGKDTSVNIIKQAQCAVMWVVLTSPFNKILTRVVLLKVLSFQNVVGIFEKSFVKNRISLVDYWRFRNVVGRVG